MSQTYIKYRVRCTDENEWKNWILSSDVSTPTTCPTDSNHNINTILTSVVETISANKVTIKEETQDTGGNFQVTTVNVISNVGQTNTALLSWPYPVSALCMKFNSSTDMFEDVLNLTIGENTIIGILTSDIATVEGNWVSQNYTKGQVVSYVHPTFGIRYYTCIANTVNNQHPTDKNFWIHGHILSVSSTVTQNTLIGYSINLYNGVNTDNLGDVLLVDKEFNLIYVELPPTNSYTTSPITYIRQTVSHVKNFKIGTAGLHSIGDNKIGGAYLPADTLVSIHYTNNGAATNKFVGSVEYLY